MTRFLKILLLWLIVGAMVWLFTLWHWQQTSRDVDLFDIVGNLLVLPTVIVAVWLLALWGIKRVRAKSDESDADGARPNPKADKDAGSQTDEALRQAHALVLDASMHTRIGADAMSAWGELKAGPARPDLDTQLQDLDGLPIFSARVAELSVDDAEAASLDTVPAVATARAMALLDGPCDQLTETWLGLMEALYAASPSDTPSEHAATDVFAAGDVPSKNHLSGVVRRSESQASTGLKSVHWSVRVLMPANWSAADQDHIVCHVRGRLAEACEQAQAWGLAAPQWQVIPPATPEAWWAEFDEQVKRWSREGSAEAMLILAVDSALDEDTVERWQAIGELFTAHHQTGRVPGEAAVGLLLASPALDARLDASVLPQPVVRLSRPVRLRRDKSADVSGRVGAATLTEAMTQALATLNVTPSGDLLVVADADHRASRTTELFEALQAVVPGLDPMENVARAGEALGDVGVARSLLSAALGCAAVWSSEGERIALAAHVQSTHDRVVLALSALNAGSVANAASV